MLPLCLLDEVGLVFGNEKVILIVARYSKSDSQSGVLPLPLHSDFPSGLRYLPPSLIPG
jgi:hypothetical protein